MMRKIGKVLGRGLLGAIIGAPSAILGSLIGFSCFAESQFFLTLFAAPLLGLVIGAVGGIIGAIISIARPDKLNGLLGTVISSAPAALIISAFVFRDFSC